jgi:hypothetical protein
MPDALQTFTKKVLESASVRQLAGAPGMVVLPLPEHYLIERSIYSGGFGPSNPDRDNATMTAAYNLWLLSDQIPLNEIDYFAVSSSGADRTYSLILGSASTFDDRGVAATALGRARQDYALSARSGLDGTGLNWHLVGTTPPNWVEAHTDAETIEATADASGPTPASLPWREWRWPPRVPQPPLSSLSPTSSVLGPIDDRVLSIGSRSNSTEVFTDGPARSGGPLVSSVKSITAKIRTVVIHRPWLDFNVFNLDGWYISGMRKGAISTGDRRGPNQLLPSVPVCMILAEDISIKTALDQLHIDRLQNMLRQRRDVTLGPFRVNAFSDVPSNIPHPPAASMDNNGISLKGPFLIAWICRILPQCPPRDPPLAQRFEVVAAAHLRGGPGTNFEELDVVKKRDILEGFKDGEWVKVKYKGKEGYVHSIALRLLN